jgi:ubiquinone/menaquinone biosynthesis C-methylase UbiE
METMDFKVAAFKERVESDWATDETAAAWQKHYPSMRKQFAAVTNALVDAADPKPGTKILDLASGTGDPALSLAKRVGPNGSVTATDFSPYMLYALRANADDAGLTNVQTKVCDAHDLDLFADESFDLVTSRFGVMFLGELEKALAEIRRVLKPGGRIALMVWGGPDPGSYFGTAALPFIKRLAEKPDPDGPSPMRFAEPGKLVRIVEKAGYSDIEEKQLTLATPFQGTPEKLLSQMMEIAAPFRNAAATLSEKDRNNAEQEVYQNLRAIERDGKINVTAPVIIVTAVSE